MPLNIDIKLNGKVLSVLTVTRLEPFVSSEYEHTYMVFEEYNNEALRSEKTATFTHRYGEGHQVCLAKAMEAWVRP